MTDFDSCFDELDKLTISKTIKKICCDDANNYNNIDGITICNKCNKIISNISENPEWRFYGSNDSKNIDPTRCGMPINILLPKSSVGTVVSNQFSKDKNMKKIKQYVNWTSMTYKERSTYKVFLDMENIAKQNNISLIILNEAKSLYKLISEIQISRGNNRKGIIAACIYFACKNCNVSRSPKELANIFNIKTPLMTKGIKKFQEIINTTSYKNRILDANSITSEDFIHRFCNKLSLNNDDINNIIEIIKKINKTNLESEIRPDSIAAGTILLYCKKKSHIITKKDIANICQISEVTINKSCKKIEEFIT
jgi:transcription initiation factor TFIIB